MSEGSLKSSSIVPYGERGIGRLSSDLARRGLEIVRRAEEARWFQDRGNAQKNLVYQTAGLVSKPALRWGSGLNGRKANNESFKARLLATPGALLVQVLRWPFPGYVFRSGLYALDPATGKQTWRIEDATDFWWRTSLVAMRESIYYVDSDCDLVTIDIARGKRTQTISTRKDYHRIMCADGDMLFVQARSPDAATSGLTEYAICAVNPVLGEEIWRAARELGRSSGLDDVWASNHRVLGLWVADRAEYVVALDRATGEESWKCSIEHVSKEYGCEYGWVDGTTLWLACSELCSPEPWEYIVIDLERGTQARTRRGFESGPRFWLHSTVCGVVYGGRSGQRSTPMFAQDAVTDQELWTLDVDIDIQCVIADHLFGYEPKPGTRIYAIERLRGVVQWELDADRPVECMTICDGVLYIVTTDGTLHAYA